MQRLAYLEIAIATAATPARAGATESILPDMDSNPWTERSTDVRWPDEGAGPYLVTVGWRLTQERWECVSVATTIVPEAGIRPLHATDLRALRLPAIVARAAVKLRAELDEAQKELRASYKTPASRREQREWRLETLQAQEALRAAQPRRAGRPPVPSAELQLVARLYAEAYRDHRPPVKAVAEKLGIGYSAAAKRVAACRRVGYLGEAEKGKAGVGMVMGTTSATMESLLAIDGAMTQRRDPGGHDGAEGRS